MKSTVERVALERMASRAPARCANGTKDGASPRHTQMLPKWLEDMAAAARPAVPEVKKALWHHDVFARRSVFGVGRVPQRP
jgi:hypothetical protein